jgi:hypothetical protein
MLIEPLSGSSAEREMRPMLGSQFLVIADLLLDNEAGTSEAEWEVRQALPIIDEYKLVPEGFAALDTSARSGVAVRNRPPGSHQSPRVLRRAERT